MIKVYTRRNKLFKYIINIAETIALTQSKREIYFTGKSPRKIWKAKIIILCKHRQTSLILFSVLNEIHAFLPCSNEDSGEQ